MVWEIKSSKGDETRERRDEGAPEDKVGYDE